MPTIKITVCKDCATRHPGCHSSCEKYLQQRAEFDEWKTEQRKQHELKQSLDGFRFEGIEKICRKRNYRSKYRREH
jgi:hypothetical protein